MSDSSGYSGLRRSLHSAHLPWLGAAHHGPRLGFSILNPPTAVAPPAMGGASDVNRRPAL